MSARDPWLLRRMGAVLAGLSALAAAAFIALMWWVQWSSGPKYARVERVRVVVAKSDEVRSGTSLGLGYARGVALVPVSDVHTAHVVAFSDGSQECVTLARFALLSVGDTVRDSVTVKLPLP